MKEYGVSKVMNKRKIEKKTKRFGEKLNKVTPLDS